MRRNTLLIVTGVGSTIVAVGVVMLKLGKAVIEWALDEQADEHPIYESNASFEPPATTTTTTTNGSYIEVKRK